jgi:hypothetical protein
MMSSTRRERADGQANRTAKSARSSAKKRNGWKPTLSHVEVGRFFEASSTVLGVSSDPGAVLTLVEIRALENLLLVDELHAVFANKDVGRSSLELVGRDGLIDGCDGRSENVVESFLVCV